MAGVEPDHDPRDERGIEPAVTAIARGVAEIRRDVHRIVVDARDRPFVDADVAEIEHLLGTIRCVVGHIAVMFRKLVEPVGSEPN